MSKSAIAQRIAVVAHDFAGGGTERIALRLAREWVRAGRTVVVLTALPDGPLAALLDPAIELVIIGPGGAAHGDESLWSRRQFARAAGRWLASHPVDALYIPGNYHFSMIGPIRRAAGADAPPIVAILSNPIERDDRRGWRRWLFRRVIGGSLAGAEAVVALAPSLAREADGLVGSERLNVIPNPVLDSLPPLSERAPRTGVVLVAAGRLMPQKNMALAIAALAALDRRDARLVLLGDGPERAHLEALAQSLGVADRVEFAGHLPSIRAALERADLFLLPSTFEGYPAVVVEALAAGVAVVATRCTPAIEDMISDPRFGSIAPADPAGFAAVIAERLSSEIPGAAEARRASVERHLIGPIAAQLSQLFNRLAQ